MGEEHEPSGELAGANHHSTVAAQAGHELLGVSTDPWRPQLARPSRRRAPRRRCRRRRRPAGATVRVLRRWTPPGPDRSRRSRRRTPPPASRPAHGAPRVRATVGAIERLVVAPARCTRVVRRRLRRLRGRVGRLVGVPAAPPAERQRTDAGDHHHRRSGRGDPSESVAAVADRRAGSDGTAHRREPLVPVGGVRRAPRPGFVEGRGDRRADRPVRRGAGASSSAASVESPSAPASSVARPAANRARRAAISPWVIPAASRATRSSVSRSGAFASLMAALPPAFPAARSPALSAPPAPAPRDRSRLVDVHRSSSSSRRNSDDGVGSRSLGSGVVGSVMVESLWRVGRGPRSGVVFSPTCLGRRWVGAGSRRPRRGAGRGVRDPVRFASGRCRAEPEHLSDLVVVEVRDVAEQHRLTELVGQRIERRGQPSTLSWPSAASAGSGVRWPLWSSTSSIGPGSAGSGRRRRRRSRRGTRWWRCGGSTSRSWSGRRIGRGLGRWRPGRPGWRPRRHLVRTTVGRGRPAGRGGEPAGPRARSGRRVRGRDELVVGAAVPRGRAHAPGAGRPVTVTSVISTR